MLSLKQKLAFNKRKVLKIALPVLALVAVLAVVGGALSRGAGAQQPAAEEKVYRVTAMTVSPTGNDVYLTYTGLIQPATTEQCTFSAVGNIQSILVKEGDFVKKGQVLARIDPESASRQAENLRQAADQADRAVAAAQKARDAAQTDYDKACVGANGEDLARAKNQLDAAKASRDAKQTERDDYNAQAESAKTALQAAQDALTAADTVVSDAQTALTAADTALADAQAALEALDETAPQEDRDRVQKLVDEATAAQSAAAADLELAQAAESTAGQAVTAAQVDLVAKQTLAAQAETQLIGLETEAAARQAAYDILKSQGADSTTAKLQKQRLDTAENALNTAKSAQLSARSGYSGALDALENCELKAASDGYVVKLVGSEGGLATPLSPVLVLGSLNSVAQFGVSQSDVRSLAVGQNATVELNGETYTGTVTSSAVLPDETTRTYTTNVGISADASGLHLGEMATVRIGVGERTGAWLPLGVILNDGEDYVYLVENGRAVRRAVTLLEVSDDMVLVGGLENGGQVICEGMKTVRSGCAVSVEQGA